jgi:hypothetical protein
MNIIGCLGVCTLLGREHCTGFTFEKKTSICYLQKFTQPNRIRSPGSINFFKTFFY